jgi:hypothetical protein
VFGEQSSGNRLKESQDEMYSALKAYRKIEEEQENIVTLINVEADSPISVPINFLITLIYFTAFTKSFRKLQI